MEPYLGMITAFGFNFAPRGWFLCNGQTLPIAQYQALFALLGTYYGGNGQTTFAIPDLRGRTLIGQGQSSVGTQYIIGQTVGTENITLLAPNLPAHTHPFTIPAVTTAGDSADPSNNRLAAGPKTGSGPNATSLKTYSTATSNATMGSGTTGITGSNNPFSIMQPSVAVSYCLAFEGIFPSRN